MIPSKKPSKLLMICNIIINLHYLLDNKYYKKNNFITLTNKMGQALMP